jgi:predicted metal-dependent phosphoesterase TrpH
MMWVFRSKRKQSRPGELPVAGSAHVARALVRGLVLGLDEASTDFNEAAAWVPSSKSPPQAIDLVHDAGGLAVMAPGTESLGRRHSSPGQAGIDGIECFHTKHSTVTTQRYLEIADRFHLLVTGGSDCHGLSKASRWSAASVPTKWWSECAKK